MGMWLHGLKVAARARAWAVGGFRAIGLYIYNIGWKVFVGEGVGGVAIDIYGYGSAAWASA